MTDAPLGPPRPPPALHLLSTQAMFSGESWDAWRAAIAALDGVALTDAQAEIYRRHTGRTTLPSAAFKEAFFSSGAEAGSLASRR